MEFLYRYIGTAQKVYDGDTITKMTLHLGFGAQLVEEQIRLFGINTFEMRDSKYHTRTEEEKQKAIFARDLLRDLTIGKQSMLKTYPTSKYKTKDKKGKYGRWLADVYVSYTDALMSSYIDVDLLTVGVHEYKIKVIPASDMSDPLKHSYFLLNDYMVFAGLATRELYK